MFQIPLVKGFTAWYNIGTKFCTGAIYERYDSDTGCKRKQPEKY